MRHYFPLAFTAAALLSSAFAPSLARGTAYLAGALFYAFTAFAVAFGVYRLALFGKQRESGPLPWLLAALVLTLLAVLAHPHSFARAIEHAIESDD